MRRRRVLLGARLGLSLSLALLCARFSCAALAAAQGAGSSPTASSPHPGREGSSRKPPPVAPASGATVQAAAPAGGGPSVRLFTIKFRDPSDVASLVGHLLSEKGSVTTQPRLRTVIVQDTRDILDKIETLIGSYDVPPRSVEFTVTLILATLAEEGRGQGISNEVRGIAEALSDITRWTNYKTLDNVKIAGSEGSVTSRELADSYRIEFNLESVSEARGIIRLNPFSLQKVERDTNGASIYRSVYTTTVNLKNEKLLTIGATKSETSPRAVFLAIRARIESP